jgi:hypothetical protein
MVKCPVHILGEHNPYLTAPDRWLRKASEVLTTTRNTLLSPYHCDELRRATLKNLPLGGEKFIFGLTRMTGRHLAVRPRGRLAKGKGSVPFSLNSIATPLLPPRQSNTYNQLLEVSVLIRRGFH